jgi:hypothetical protein
MDINQFLDCFSLLKAEYVISLLRDIVVASSAVWVAWVGNKGIRKYLFDDDLRECTKRIRSANEAAHLVASEILYEMDSKNWQIAPASQSDIDSCLCWAERLCKATQGASSSVQTYSFYLRHFFMEVKPRYEVKDIRFNVVSNIDFINIVYRVVDLIVYDSAHIVDIPEPPSKSHKIKRKGAASFVIFDTSIKYSANRFGLNLLPNSKCAYDFYSVVSLSSSYMLRVECLKVIRSNIPAVLELFEHNIYVPPMFGPDRNYNPSLLQVMTSDPLYLIGIKKINYIGEKKGVYWKFLYSNLDGDVKCSDMREYLKLVKENYWDLATNSQQFNKVLDRFVIHAQNIIVFEVEASGVEKLGMQRKRQLKRWLKDRGVTG